MRERHGLACGREHARRTAREDWSRGKIACLVPTVLHCDQGLGGLASGNEVHRTTVSRCVREVVGLLAARTPSLDRALKKIARKGGGVVLLDGSLICTRAKNRKNYSGKSKCHGLLVIALTDDRDRLVWGSAVSPGGPRRSPPVVTTNSRDGLRSATVASTVKLHLRQTDIDGRHHPLLERVTSHRANIRRRSDIGIAPDDVPDTHATPRRRSKTIRTSRRSVKATSPPRTATTTSPAASPATANRSSARRSARSSPTAPTACRSTSTCR